MTSTLEAEIAELLPCNCAMSCQCAVIQAAILAYVERKIAKEREACAAVALTFEAWDVIANKPVDVKVRDQTKALLNWLVAKPIASAIRARGDRDE